MMSVSGVAGSSSESLMTTTTAKTTAETEMNPLREIASVMMVSLFAKSFTVSEIQTSKDFRHSMNVCFQTVCISDIV